MVKRFALFFCTLYLFSNIEIFSQKIFIKEKYFEGNLLNGVPDSTWQYYYSDGQIAIVAHFLNGKRDSLWQYYNTEGRLITQIAYKNDLKHGTFQSFYPDGNTEWIKNYSRNQIVGFTNAFYPNGQVKKQTGIKDGQFHGFYREYHSNGNTKLEAMYEMGKLMELYFINSELGDTLIKHPIKSGFGIYFEYYDSGVLKSKTEFKSGIKSGLFEQYDESGKKVIFGKYLEDQKKGKWNYQIGGNKKTVNYDKKASEPLGLTTPTEVASFPGDKQAMLLFLEKETQNLTKQTYFVKLAIDDFGKIENYEFLREYKESDKKKISELIEQMPLWIPARRQGEPIKSEYILTYTVK